MLNPVLARMIGNTRRTYLVLLIDTRTQGNQIIVNTTIEEVVSQLHSRKVSSVARVRARYRSSYVSC